jgi:hypothetical protein
MFQVTSLVGVPSPDRERHGALGRNRQVGRDQRPVTDAASTVGTASAAGVVAEVLYLGLGRREDFERHANQIRGRIVIVRHEYPFATGHVHRRVKLGLAQQMGARRTSIDEVC